MSHLQPGDAAPDVLRRVLVPKVCVVWSNVNNAAIVGPNAADLRSSRILALNAAVHPPSCIFDHAVPLIQTLDDFALAYNVFELSRTMIFEAGIDLFPHVLESRWAKLCRCGEAGAEVRVGVRFDRR